MARYQARLAETHLRMQWVRGLPPGPADRQCCPPPLARIERASEITALSTVENYTYDRVERSSQAVVSEGEGPDQLGRDGAGPHLAER